MFGSGAGGQSLMIDNYARLHERGPRTVAPTFIANALVDSCSGMIAIETGAIGHNLCIVSACATGTHNVAEAAEAIRRGDCIAIISGSTEMPLLEVGHAGFGNMRGLGNPRPGEPIIERVARPFDLTRDGFVLGEGAASLFLEDLELAKARGAKIYAEVVGYGSAADGWDMIQPVEGGAGSARAMKMALERRGVPADEVDLINPHGTSTPLGDKREAEAIWTVFGDHTPDIAISATKSMTGHMMGAAGAFEAFATVLSVAEQTRPGDASTTATRIRSCDLNIPTESRAARDPLRPVEQHRPRRPQRRGDLQALRRRLIAPPPRARRTSPLQSDAPPLPDRCPAEVIVPQLGPRPPRRRDRPRRGHADRQRLPDLLGATSRPASPGPARSSSFDASALRGPDRGRGPRLRPGRSHGAEDGPPDEPVHPLRDGRRQGGGRRRRDRLRGDETRTPATGSASSSTPAAAGSSRSSTGPTSYDTQGPRFVSAVRGARAVGLDGRRMLSMEYGLTGPVMTQVAACATSVIAFHDALRLIADRRVRRRPRRRLGGAGPGRWASRRSATWARCRGGTIDPRPRSRPFDRDRDGFVLGEGGGVVVVESLAHALERGATPIAEIIGGALTADAFHISAPEPTGRGQTRAMDSPCATPA